MWQWVNGKLTRQGQFESTTHVHFSASQKSSDFVTANDPETSYYGNRLYARGSVLVHLYASWYWG